jgi:sarcosine oxidase subunit alpha
MSSVDGWSHVLRYRDTQTEMQTASSAGGICDMTPLVKIDVRGNDSAKVVARLFEGQLPEINGCISGVLSGCQLPVSLTRLTVDRFMVLAPPSCREQINQNFREAAQVSQCVHVTDMTSAFMAMYLFGPKIPEMLKKLGSAPIDQMNTQSCVQVTTARVWSLLIHMPAPSENVWLLLASRDYGEYVWESVLEAGHALGIEPMGVIAAQAFTGMEAIHVAAV